jgi:hypothetical protein
MQSPAPKTLQPSATDPSAVTDAGELPPSVFPLAKSVPWLCDTAQSLAIRNGYRHLPEVDQGQVPEWERDNDSFVDSFVEQDMFVGLHRHLDKHDTHGLEPDLFDEILQHKEADTQLSNCARLLQTLKRSNTKLHQDLCTLVRESTFCAEDIRQIELLYYIVHSRPGGPTGRRLKQWMADYTEARSKLGSEAESDVRKSATGAARSEGDAI